MKLSVQTANALEPGKVLKCHVVPGLELHGNVTGRTWKFYHRIDGQQRRPAIGKFPDLGIEAAREIVKDYKKAIARGEDPFTARAQRRAEITVAELADAFLEDGKTTIGDMRRPKAPRTLDENRRHIRLYIKPKLGKKKISAVERQDVNDMLDDIARTAPAYANRVRDTVSGMFTFAAYKKWHEGENPAFKSSIFAEYKRRRHATPAECVAMSQALAELRDQYPERVAAILVILYAGTRVTELVTCRREWREGNVITIQKHKTERTGEDRVIYLPRQAVEILDGLADDGSGLIFGKGMNRHRINDCWSLARERAGCPDLQVLDLRRTFASAAKSRGASLDAVGELFGHKDSDTTRRYAWLFADAAEALTQNTADELERRMLPAPMVTEDYWSG